MQSGPDFHVGLVALHVPVGQFPAAEVDARVAPRALEAVSGAEFEVGRLAAAPEEIAGMVERMLFGGLAGDGPVLDRPVARLAFPAGEVLAVEKWHKALIARRGAKSNSRTREQSRQERKNGRACEFASPIAG